MTTAHRGDQYLRRGDVVLRYRDERRRDEQRRDDPGNGGVLVLIHGWTLDLEMWAPQVEDLGTALRIVRLDRRGFGLSTGRPSLEGDVDDLLALLDVLQIGEATLLGMSQGARVALAFAQRAPWRVTSLVLDGPPDYAGDPGSGADDDLPLAAYRELVRTGGVDAFRRAWREHPFVQLRTADPRMRALLEAMLLRYPGRDLEDDLAPAAPVSDPLDPDALGSLRQPVLVLNGELDTQNRRRAGELLAQKLECAQRVLVPGAGHLANLDAPRIYNQILRQFLPQGAQAAA